MSSIQDTDMTRRKQMLDDYKRILRDTLRLRRHTRTSYRLMKRCRICDAEYDPATVAKNKSTCGERCRLALRRLQRREQILKL